MSENPLVQSLCDRLESLKSQRSRHEEGWDSVRRFVRPNTVEFLGGRTQQRHGESANFIYDSTAPWALQQLAAGLDSNLTGDSDRWFGLTEAGVPPHHMDREVQDWAAAAADRIFFELSLGGTNWSTGKQEVYLDLGAFGNAVISHRAADGSGAGNRIAFRPFPLANCYFGESFDGTVDIMFVEWDRTVRQISEMWPEAMLQDEFKRAKPDECFVVVHAVMPRGERGVAGALNPLDKPWASYWFIPGKKMVLSEGGFDLFPYITPRWTKVAGETYGRSPGLTTLPDIRVLNQMVKETLVSAQINNRPPLVIDEDEFLLPLPLVPGGVIQKHPGAEAPTQLPTGGDFNLTLEMMAASREAITRGFYVDWLLRPKKKERQTRLEIQDDRDEMFRQLGPVLGRLQREFLEPTVAATYTRLLLAGQIPEPPAGFSGAPLEVTYVSPSQRAQLRGQGAEMAELLQSTVVPLMNVDPSVADSVNWNNVLPFLTSLLGVSAPEIFRTPEEVAEMAEQRQMQQALQAAQPAATALKDVAQAQQLGLSL